ncbi:hypothetical protein B6S12_08560 [Helicobacter valdiviensis]|uniref:Uncharacterized protein n=1 Tax=Helicobacter valdiviensis TaxID=1458358 RepID=A0A2W6MSM0_9HELI|nr:hypothetical protein [Helicobacter valdiviensis]PZT47554.1 hypothetical protein B6S12_08560 [Helicobacter valdiviensis]
MLNNFSSKVYQKKNGELMFYINSINEQGARVSVGFGDKIYTSKMTTAQKRLLEEWFKKLESLEATISDFKELETHHQKADLDFEVKLFITDNAEIAGNKVLSDGAYILYKKNLYSLEEICGSFEK